MKKNLLRIKYVFTLCAVMALFFIMTGCSAGSTVDTQMKINDNNFSGSRVMTVTIDDEVFSENFNATADDMVDVIDKNLPQGMEYTYSVVDDVKTFVFEIDFDSYDDYCEKINNILAESYPDGFEADVTFRAPESIWASGVELKENFPSSFLLQWAIDDMVECGFVDSGNANYILDEGNTEFIYMNESLDESVGLINFSNIEELAINTIDTVIDINDIDDYSVKIMVAVPQASINAKEDAINEYMKSVCSSKAKLSTKEDNGIIYTIEAENVNFEDMADVIATAFGKDNVVVKKNSLSADDYSPLQLAEYFTIDIDYANYIDENNSTTKRNFVMGGSEDCTICSTDNPQNYYPMNIDSAVYDGYATIWSGTYRYSEEPVNILVIKETVVDAVDIEVKTNGSGSKVTKTVDFIFSEELEEEDVSNIIESLSARVADLSSLSEESMTSQFADEEEVAAKTEEEEVSKADSEENVSNDSVAIDNSVKGVSVTIEKKKNDGKTVIRIIEKTDEYRLAALDDMIFSGNNEFYYGRELGATKVGKEYAMTLNFDFCNILTGEYYISHKPTIVLTIKAPGKISYAAVDGLELLDEISGRKVEYTLEGRRVKCEISGQYTDFMAVLFWILLIAGVGLIIFAVFKSGIVVSGVKSKTVSKKQERFCTECGAKVEDESSFCPACGHNMMEADEVKTKDEAKPEAKDEAKPEAKDEAKPEAKDEAKPEAKDEVKPEAKDEAKPEAKDEIKSESKFCAECGTKLDADIAFCPECGTKVE